MANFFGMDVKYQMMTARDCRFYVIHKDTGELTYLTSSHPRFTVHNIAEQMCAIPPDKQGVGLHCFGMEGELVRYWGPVFGPDVFDKVLDIIEEEMKNPSSSYLSKLVI